MTTILYVRPRFCRAHADFLRAVGYDVIHEADSTKSVERVKNWLEFDVAIVDNEFVDLITEDQRFRKPWQDLIELIREIYGDAKKIIYVNGNQSVKREDADLELDPFSNIVPRIKAQLDRWGMKA